MLLIGKKYFVTGATGAVAGGLKISINGTPYWIMLAAADE